MLCRETAGLHGMVGLVRFTLSSYVLRIAKATGQGETLRPIHACKTLGLSGMHGPSYGTVLPVGLQLQVDPTGCSMEGWFSGP